MENQYAKRFLMSFSSLSDLEKYLSKIYAKKSESYKHFEFCEPSDTAEVPTLIVVGTPMKKAYTEKELISFLMHPKLEFGNAEHINRKTALEVLIIEKYLRGYYPFFVL